jgi:hypothetical protein
MAYSGTNGARPTRAILWLLRSGRPEDSFDILSPSATTTASPESTTSGFHPRIAYSGKPAVLLAPETPEEVRSNSP